MHCSASTVLCWTSRPPTSIPIRSTLCILTDARLLSTHNGFIDLEWPSCRSWGHRTASCS
ncbi:hypothetical protein IEO21_02363 [Rhodonia placenta]|uniref:Uncharacterized protein n=1 Tax=Rhodonia placenta TaxID=104341 RepID=A0A8H7U569_9APHY|nr:hypothetical protein IEO21_02363 [Postia placenta]